MKQFKKDAARSASLAQQHFLPHAATVTPPGTPDKDGGRIIELVPGCTGQQLRQEGKQADSTWYADKNSLMGSTKAMARCLLLSEELLDEELIEHQMQQLAGTTDPFPGIQKVGATLRISPVLFGPRLIRQWRGPIPLNVAGLASQVVADPPGQAPGNPTSASQKALEQEDLYRLTHKQWPISEWEIWTQQAAWQLQLRRWNQQQRRGQTLEHADCGVMLTRWNLGQLLAQLALREPLHEHGQRTLAVPGWIRPIGKAALSAAVEGRHWQAEVTRGGATLGLISEPAGPVTRLTVTWRGEASSGDTSREGRLYHPAGPEQREPKMKAGEALSTQSPLWTDATPPVWGEW